MMLRYLLLFLLAIVVARAAWRVVGGVTARLAGQSRHRPGGHVQTRGVQMVRDPVCGTYVVRNRALVLADGFRQVFFCSANCRDAYRTRPSARSGGSESAEGRTA